MIHEKTIFVFNLFEVKKGFLFRTTQLSNINSNYQKSSAKPINLQL
ncbi:unnamed protein product [Paramecium pentaurelia]|uniref:Uncharacterized protein n=1 Tax=Paramecium pentaurelia TaxID=43138 RepID=A0A8S1T1D4_9CILI|nr:unnamed protein product [Paramecium pentaurelia]